MKGRYFSIRTKLIFMSLSVIAALAICGIMLYVENGQTNAFIRQAFLRQNTLNAYIDEISNMYRALRGYLSEHNEENYCNYLDSCSRLQRRVSDLTQQFQSRLALDQYKMTLGLLDKAKVLVFINDTMHQDTVLVDYEQNIALIIESYPLLMKDMGQVVQHTYEQLTNTLLQRHIYLWCFSLLVCLGCIFFVVTFSDRITRSIRQLTIASTRILSGKRDEVCNFHGTNDETRVCIEAFNNMVRALVGQVEIQNQRAELECRLRKETERLANTEKLLFKAEMFVLQSRINPHFLFNTLNSVVQLAYIEGALRTMNTASLLSDYLRYALDTLNCRVTLLEELENIETYIAIQRERYGNRIMFFVQKPTDSMDIKVPSMIIEPLVENAISHGVKNYASNGYVNVNVTRIGDQLTIEVNDNGIGMEQSQLRVLRETLETEVPLQTESAIGLHNVIRRMRLMFGDAFRWYIESQPHVRTVIRLEFPCCTLHCSEDRGNAPGQWEVE